MSELHFRSMEGADIGACSDLFCKVFSAPPWNEDVSPKEARRYFENCFSLASFRGFVAESGGRIVGLAAGFLKPWRKGMEFYLDEFCVAPSFQGKGSEAAFSVKYAPDLPKRAFSAPCSIPSAPILPIRFT